MFYGGSLWLLLKQVWRIGYFIPCWNQGCATRGLVWQACIERESGAWRGTWRTDRLSWNESGMIDTKWERKGSITLNTVKDYIALSSVLNHRHCQCSLLLTVLGNNGLWLSHANDPREKSACHQTHSTSREPILELCDLYGSHGHSRPRWHKLCRVCASALRLKI